MDKKLQKIIKHLSKKHNLPVYKIELIIMSEFQFLRDMIEKGEGKSLRLMHLGRFKMKEYHKNSEFGEKGSKVVE